MKKQIENLVKDLENELYDFDNNRITNNTFSNIVHDFVSELGKIIENIDTKYYCNSENMLEGRCDKQCDWCKSNDLNK